jgi:hypothetical protein
MPQQARPRATWISWDSAPLPFPPQGPRPRGTVQGQRAPAAPADLRPVSRRLGSLKNQNTQYNFISKIQKLVPRVLRCDRTISFDPKHATVPLPGAAARTDDAAAARLPAVRTCLTLVAAKSIDDYKILHAWFLRLLALFRFSLGLRNRRSERICARSRSQQGRHHFPSDKEQSTRNFFFFFCRRNFFTRARDHFDGSAGEAEKLCRRARSRRDQNAWQAVYAYGRRQCVPAIRRGPINYYSIYFGRFFFFFFFLCPNSVPSLP